MLILQLYHLNK